LPRGPGREVGGVRGAGGTRRAARSHARTAPPRGATPTRLTVPVFTRTAGRGYAVLGPVRRVRASGGRFAFHFAFLRTAGVCVLGACRLRAPRAR
ncbi:hypothetical protein, partial [Streptomyces sp. SID11385]|uniref:hypothetical protein n=1 Tax=Streptomyces sp. SID11385 TaxID=2706031 RepID=UPI001940CBC8